MTQEIKQFGHATQLEASLGLDAVVAPKLASIIVFAANIEHRLERAIWVLDGLDPQGIRPRTDAKPIGDQIVMLEKHAARMQSAVAQDTLKIWCSAARAGFTIRHNIAHGVSFKMGKTLVFSRNPRWHGEVRKRDFGDLWCEPYILDLVREALAVLLRIIGAIAQDRESPLEVASPRALRAVREASSILGEFADQCYNPSFEKY